MQKFGFRETRLMAVVAAALAVPAWSQPASAPTLVALTSLEPGQWQLRSRSEPNENRSICLGDTQNLIQIRHGHATCSRFVIANDAKSATVHYTCPGAGHGRTTVRVETPRLIQLDSQGIADNEPFALTFEGRRVGACGVAANSTH
ncbi:MAG: hypothetical protein RL367_1693 [Pseudomonadota bacterium]